MSDNTIDYKEKLLKDFEGRMVTRFREDEIEMASMCLMMALNEYRVEKEPRDLALLDDDYNEKVLKAYCGCLMIEGKSKNTIKAYSKELKRLSDTLSKRYDKMMTSDIRIYLASMKNRGCNNTTEENSRAYLSSFFRWLTGEGLIEKNPMLLIKPIKIHPKTEEPFSESEVYDLRLACKKASERALIEVALSSGLRCSELANLKITDVNLRTYEVHVRHGKGDKYRISYISELAARCIERYLAKRDDECDIMFLSRNGGGSHYTSIGIYKIINQIGERAGIENVHPHRFRHTTASNLAARGMPIHEIKQILGHSDINTTMRYVHISQEAIKSSFERFS